MRTPEPNAQGDDLRRCAWCAGHDDYVAYHDLEWGFPVADGHRPVGLDPVRHRHRLVARQVDVAVVEDDPLVVADLVGEDLPVLGERQDAVPSLHPHVVGELERRLDDHADAAVAADRGIEEVGVLLWAVNTYIPMDGKIKQILNIVVVIAVVLWLLQVFGIFSGFGDMRVG